MGYRGVLHTYSKYADFSFELPSIKGTYIIAQINSLREKEESFYNQMFPGCRTIEGFIREIRNLFEKEEGDKETFRMFKSSEISQILTQKFGVIDYDKTEINITFQTSNIDFDIGNLNIKNAKITNEGENKVLTINAEAFKDTFNKMFDKRYRVNTKSLSALRKFLKTLEGKDSETLDEVLTPFLKEKGVKLINIQGKTSSTTNKILETPSFFGYTNEDIQAAKNDPVLKKEIQKAKQQIKNFILQLAKQRGASENMIAAINQTWKDNFGYKLDNIAFWEKGGTLNSLIGAFGEFQAALLPNYIKAVLKNSKIPPSLISETINSTEQGKMDVNLLGRFGVQVKNYKPGRNRIKSNIHPQNLAESPSFDIDKTSFFDFLTNYYFNLTYQDNNKGNMAQLEGRLSDYFAEIASLDTEEGLEDKCTFYFIEGQYFVPASFILMQNYQNLLTQAKIEVTSKYKGKTDKEYSSFNKETKHHNFEEWWEPKGNGIFDPTKKNRKTYQNLIQSEISIRTHFSYRGLGGSISRFALF